MRIDLHCHSEASADSETPLRALGERALAQGLSVLAVTDHNEIWGAEKLRELTRSEPELQELTVIIGEEITSTAGEIIGLFLQEKIPRGVTPKEAVESIHAQGGLVLLPHGFDRFKGGRLLPDARNEIADAIDIVEGFNRRVSFPRYNQYAQAWADQHDKRVSVGSDAHTLREVGRAWLEVPDRVIAGPDDLMAILPEGTIEGRWRQPILAYIQKVWSRLVR